MVGDASWRRAKRTVGAWARYSRSSPGTRVVATECRNARRTVPDSGSSSWTICSRAMSSAAVASRAAARTSRPAGVQPQPAVLTLEEPGAERVLDPAQRARQARLRDAQLVRCRRQVLGAGEGDEPAQVLGLHPHTIRLVHRSASLASFHV